jgi:hypothetical protein
VAGYEQCLGESMDAGDVARPDLDPLAESRYRVCAFSKQSEPLLGILSLVNELDGLDEQLGSRREDERGWAPTKYVRVVCTALTRVLTEGAS